MRGKRRHFRPVRSFGNILLLEHNQIIRVLAAESKVPLVDLDADMTGREEFFWDHVHCNERGNATKAELIAVSPGLLELIEESEQQRHVGAE